MKYGSPLVTRQTLQGADDTNSSVAAVLGGTTDRKINNKTSHGGIRAKTKKLNMDIEIEVDE